MTYFHYYASTIRNLADVGKYAIYPAAYAAGMVVANQRSGLSIAQKNTIAANTARITTAFTYSAISTIFHALESEMIDANSREAVAAEMGIDPEKVKYSDYGRSHNVIVNNAYHDGLKIQKYRYGTDLMFLVPAILSKFAPNMHHQINAAGFNEWDFVPFAGKAAYWAGETFALKKSGNYEIVKLRENLESTGKDLSANDLMGVYQRNRTDKKVPEIESKAEIDAVRPLLQRMADEYNKREGFSLSEIVYLIGLDKINVHGDDGRTVTPEAVQKSMQEIDKVVSIGLDGIREENRKLHQQQAAMGILPTPKPATFTERFADTAFDTSQKIITAVSGKKRHFKPEEYISVRDPGEIVSWNFDVNR